MTHVLISITDWENLKSGNVITFVNVEARNEFLVNLVEKSKQISLDKKDINAKAYNHLAKLTEEELEVGAAELTVNGYKQALEDLKTIK